MVVAGVILEHMLDVGWIRQEKAVIRAGLQMRDVAVSIRRVEERADRIRPEMRKYSEERIPARSWREP